MLVMCCLITMAEDAEYMVNLLAIDAFTIRASARAEDSTVLQGQAELFPLSV